MTSHHQKKANELQKDWRFNLISDSIPQKKLQHQRFFEASGLDSFWVQNLNVAFDTRNMHWCVWIIIYLYIVSKIVGYMKQCMCIYVYIYRFIIISDINIYVYFVDSSFLLSWSFILNIFYFFILRWPDRGSTPALNHPNRWESFGRCSEAMQELGGSARAPDRFVAGMGAGCPTIFLRNVQWKE